MLACLLRSIGVSGQDETMARWYAFELQWDAAPPMPQHLRVIERLIHALDPEIADTETWTRARLTADGMRADWRSPLVELREVARVVGERWPCRVRWLCYDACEENVSDRFEWLCEVPWLCSCNDLGRADGNGCLRVETNTKSRGPRYVRRRCRK